MFYRVGVDIFVVVEDFFPRNASRDEMIELQRGIAKRAVFEDDLADRNLDAETASVAGVDQAFARDGEVAVSAAVVLRGSEVVETATARRETEIPYIPGLLAFREGRAVTSAVERLDSLPDVVLVDGSGRIHPRQAGLATHVGVALNVPTVGVAKSLLCGEPRRPFDRLETGESVEVVADDDVEVPDGTVIGYAYQSKQYADDASTSVNPLYVSPGHRVSAETAVNVVAEACDGYKLPDPVRRADTLADEARTELDG